MAEKRRLGRGLDSLLSGVATATAEPTPKEKDHLRTLPVDLLQRGKYQPRK